MAQTKNEVLLFEKEVSGEGVDFMDGETHGVEVECSNDEIRVYFSSGGDGN